MSWADIKRKYAQGGALASQSTEDMAARRILRALGVAEKGLPTAEKAAGLADRRQDDTTLLERAEALAAFAGVRGLPAVRDVRNLREAEDVALELVEQGRPCPWLVYRVRGTDNLTAVRRLGSTLLDVGGAFPLPCRLFRSRDGSWVLGSCDAQVLYDTLMNREVQNG